MYIDTRSEELKLADFEKPDQRCLYRSQVIRQSIESVGFLELLRFLSGFYKGTGAEISTITR